MEILATITVYRTPGDSTIHAKLERGPNCPEVVDDAYCHLSDHLYEETAEFNEDDESDVEDGEDDE